jgi:hypothetical protein
MTALHRAVPGFAAAVLASLALVPPAAAQPSRAGEVNRVVGDVTAVRATTPQPSPLRFRDDVFVADRIVTGDQSMARLLLGGGKATVTARERSILTITDSVTTSTVEVPSGRISLAVVKERVKRGEVIQIRTPSAVAAVRGTVVVAEVWRSPSDPGVVRSRFTVLRGVVEVTPLDAAGRPTGAMVTLRRLQAIDLPLGGGARDITETDGRLLAASFEMPLGPAPTINAGQVEAQVEQAATAVRDLDPAVARQIGIPGPQDDSRRPPILPGGEAFRPAPPPPPSNSHPSGPSCC